MKAPMKTPNKPLTYILVKPAGPDCNLACTYCFYYEKKHQFSGRKHRMSDETLETMIRQAMEQSGQSIGFGWQGGEPTLMGLDFYRRVVELQKHYGSLYSRNFRGGKTVSNGLQTNGILLNEEWATFLKENHFLVGISLDGPAHIHDRYRTFQNQSGSHQQVEKNAELLLKHDVEVNALSVVNDYSVQFPEETYAYLKDVGFKYLQFIPIVETNPENPKEAAPFSVSPEAYGDFLCTLFDLWKKDFDAEGLPTISVRMFDSLVQRYMGIPSGDCTAQRECGIYVVVEHTGDVYSCDFFVEDTWHLGSIRESRLIDLLNSKKQTIFGQLKTKLPKKCLSCRWLTLCRGGCTKDRLRDPSDRKLNHFCGAYKQFYAHADADLKKIAQNVIAYRKRHGTW